MWDRCPTKNVVLTTGLQTQRRVLLLLDVSDPRDDRCNSTVAVAVAVDTVVVVVVVVVVAADGDLVTSKAMALRSYRCC